MITLSQSERPLTGTLLVPGDKTASLCAIVSGAVSKGTTTLTGVTDDVDCTAMIQCLQAMGVQIDSAKNEDGDTVLFVNGRGLYSLKAPTAPLHVTDNLMVISLICGLLSAQAFRAKLQCDTAIDARLLNTIMTPLTEMGALIKCDEDSLSFPMQITGSRLQALAYTSTDASVEVKSSILFASLYANAATVIREPYPSSDYVERLLQFFGADIVTQFETATDIRDDSDFDGVRSLQEALHFFGDMQKGKPVITLTPGAVLRGQQIRIPGDFSFAAFFIVAALLIKDSDIVLQNVGMNPTRNGFIKVLKELGADIEIISREDAPEPTADLHVCSSELQCPGGELDISGVLIPTLIAELPILAVVAAFAKGTTCVKVAPPLFTDEKKRIILTVKNLRAMGAEIRETDDGFIITGGKQLHAPDSTQGIVLETNGDRRIAMAFAIAALATNGTTTIDDGACLSAAYSTFFRDLTTLS